MRSFNVVIATAGRKSLKRSVQSIVKQLNTNDYLTIIFDGAAVDDTVYAGARCTVNVYHEPTALGHWGHGARNKYQDSLPGDFILNGDDDDVWSANAMEILRNKTVDGKLNVFKFYMNNGTFPMKPYKMGIGKCGTPNGVYPNIGNFPQWALMYGGDGVFYEELSKRIEPIWHEDVIYILRPEKNAELLFLKPTACSKCNCASMWKDDRPSSIVWECRRCGHKQHVKKKNDYPLL